MSAVLLIAVGAALGACARFIIDRRLNGRWPRGTLLVNLLGSLILGIAVGYSLSTPSGSALMLALVGTGFCGGFTTFSTFSLETLELLRAGRAGTAALYVCGSVAAGLLGVWLAMRLARGA